MPATKLRCSSIMLLVVLSAVLPPGFAAQASASTWECLPEETVVAVRVPDGRALAEAIVCDTKFGAVMFSDKKQAAVAAVLETGNSAAWSEFQGQLEEYGLTSDALTGLLAGESGYAVVMAPCSETTRGVEESMLVGFAWFEPGEELSRQVYEVIAQAIDDQEDEQFVTRVDLTLADERVMQLQVHSVAIEYEDEFDLGDEYDELPESEQREAREKAYRQWQASAVETAVCRTVLVSQLGGRLLIAHHYHSREEETAAAAAESLSAVFAQWIAAQEAGINDFLQPFADDPGTARVMAVEGLPLFELLGDATPLVRLLRASAPSDEQAEQVVRILGLDSLGAFAMRSTLLGTQWSTSVSVAAAAPRQGLMQLFDQEHFAIDPPQWVPASVVRYHQWSFDLGKAYQIIKEVTLREFPDQAAGGFTMAETYVQNFAKASLAEVLSSLGNRHTIMSFGLQSGDTAADHDHDDTNSENHADQIVRERVACIWQVEDEVLWARLLNAVKPFAGMAPGAEFVREQGFSGWRMKRGANEGGLFLGKGFLVLGVGTGVIESILSSLNSPPAGSDALRGSKVFVAANTSIDLEPALAAEITDGDRYLSMMIGRLDEQLKEVSNLLEQVDSAGDNEQSDEDSEVGSNLMLSLLRAVLPGQNELKGLMGVRVSRWEVNDDGLFGESVQEMPAP